MQFEKRLKLVIHSCIPQDGFECIQYSNPWSWSSGGMFISLGFVAAMITTHFETLYFLPNPTALWSTLEEVETTPRGQENPQNPTQIRKPRCKENANW